jgi:hypothetical protein
MNRVVVVSVQLVSQAKKDKKFCSTSDPIIWDNSFEIKEKGW